MFSGRYAHNIDSKGRVSFPARFREVLGDIGDDRIVLTNHIDHRLCCLDAWPVSTWQRVLKRARRLPRFQKETIYYHRWVVSSAVECPVDGTGRILVPAYYRKQARMEKEILWSGVGENLELWAAQEWEHHIQTLCETSELDLNALNPIFEDEPGPSED